MSIEIRRSLAHLAESWQQQALAVANHIANELAKSIPKATSRPKRGRDIKKRRA